MMLLLLLLLFYILRKAGLLLAYTLLQSKNETNVCVFEKEDRLGGKIFDHRFPEAPNVTVGESFLFFAYVEGEHFQIAIQ